MKRLIPLFLSAGICLPWMILRIMGFHGHPSVEAALSGLAVLGAAFLLAWAAELAQLEISAALAVAVLSFVAVLPEYAVDIYFAWQAGKDPSYASFAVANMTGANRLLIGVGWSLVIVLFWWKTQERILQLGDKDRLELGALTLATLYALSIPFKGSLSLIDTAVLIFLFILYIRATTRQGVEEPELMGPAEALATFPQTPRRVITGVMFLFSAAAILLAAEPFAEGLVETGTILGIDEFLLVQWLAPLASEAPEFIIASLFALQGRAALGIRAMISSKVNQWTLLVGMLPLAFAISAGSFEAMPIDARQEREIWLTAAQSFYAVAILANLNFSLRAALALFGLFTAQFILGYAHWFSILYLILGLIVLIRSHGFTGLKQAVQTLFKNPA